jgi:hypothetical protein
VGTAQDHAEHCDQLVLCLSDLYFHSDVADLGLADFAGAAHDGPAGHTLGLRAGTSTSVRLSLVCSHHGLTIWPVGYDQLVLHNQVPHHPEVGWRRKS